MAGGVGSVETIELRLSDADEFMHEVGPEPTFNESMYLNVYDPVAGAGGFFRLGNRPNEGTGEMTVCLFLPDGARVGFAFDRPVVGSNERLSSGGLTFSVGVPFESLDVTYDGRVAVLDDPLALVDPRAALTSSPWVRCAVSLRVTGRSNPFGGEPDRPLEAAGEEFARGHYEQLVEVEGEIRIDAPPGTGEWPAGGRLALHGFGLRDHSWGPRTWQAPWYYRWCTANFGAGRGFCGTRVARREGPGIRGGFWWSDGTLTPLDDFRVRTTWSTPLAAGSTGAAGAVGSPDGGTARPPDRPDARDVAYQAAMELELVAGGTCHRVTGRVLRMVPLRNRRRHESSGDLLVTRIAEGLTQWTLSDGSVGYGLAEYLDQLVDGVPVGIGE